MPRRRLPRHGAALLYALFVMTLASTLVIATLDSHVMRYAALRNTKEWDEARYLAEAGLNDAFARLEQNIDWRDGIPTTEFPVGSGATYSVVVSDGADGTVNIASLGTVGNFTRRLQATIKHGG
ncbi:hypothetical protein [Planctomycetes bacterium K23_9]